MSFAPNDLVSDADLLAYEADILTAFQRTDWADKRAKAIEDWLTPILAGQGFSFEQLRTRYEADKVWAYTGSAYTDKTSAAQDATADDLNLATIFATAGSDVLYVGSTRMFRGLSVRMTDSVSAVSATLTVSYWGDTWRPLTITDGTQATQGKAFSGGGSITWRVPTNWVKRAINSSSSLYWVKVVISATPSGATAGQMGVIRRSMLCAPVTFRTLMLIMREAPTSGAGPWLEKAAWYETEADAALQRALPNVGGEFDADASDQISADEADQTVAEVSTGFRLERH